MSVKKFLRSTKKQYRVVPDRRLLDNEMVYFRLQVRKPFGWSNEVFDYPMPMCWVKTKEEAETIVKQINGFIDNGNND